MLTVIGVFISDLAAGGARPAHPAAIGAPRMSEMVQPLEPLPVGGPRSPAFPDPLPHYVSSAPFDPMAVEAMSASQERYNQASQCFG